MRYGNSVAHQRHHNLRDPPSSICSWERSVSAYTALNRPVAALDAQAGLARMALANGDTALALIHVADAMARIDSGWRMGLAWDPLRIMLTCCQAFAASGDSRANEYLESTHAALRQRAELLDPDDKRAFLGRVPTNIAIAEAWQAQAGASP